MDFEQAFALQAHIISALEDVVRLCEIRFQITEIRRNDRKKLQTEVIELGKKYGLKLQDNSAYKYEKVRAALESHIAGLEKQLESLCSSEGTNTVSSHDETA